MTTEQAVASSSSLELLQAGFSRLADEDPELFAALEGEYRRQAVTLSLVASSSYADPPVLAVQSSVAVNVTAEGYPGRRYHAGCHGVDELESLAIARARQLFDARYANVQPHTATTANHTVLSALLRPGDTILGMDLAQGGHLTHGSPAAYSGTYFRAVGYGLTSGGLIDYEQVRRLAQEHRPRLIICGATAYSRTVDFARFREIADDVGAYLLADISHTAGLVAAGLHPSPIDHAHITTTCTHKQLFGPRGGLILSGRDADAPAPRGRGTLADFLQRAIFPFTQGAPMLNAIAAKARALAYAQTPTFRMLAERIVADARALAVELGTRDYKIVSGGTDNHIVLIDLSPRGLTGLAAQECLEDCGIIVNKNRVPNDQMTAFVTSGIRLGTNGAAWRGMGPAQARACAGLLDEVLRDIYPTPSPRVSAETRTRVRAAVEDLCREFPICGYPAPYSAAPTFSAPG
jgi:glycine hydroxymethyltransferase